MRDSRSLVLSSARVGRASLADAHSFLVSAPSSAHARRRAAQRNLVGDAVDYILTWGRPINRTGVEFYVLARKDIPAPHRCLPQVMRLAGAVVLVASDGAVITLYRHPNSLRAIQRKLKYRLTPASKAHAADAEEGDGAADVEAPLR